MSKTPEASVLYILDPDAPDHLIARYAFDDYAHYEFEWESFKVVNNQLPLLQTFFEKDRGEGCFPKKNSRKTFTGTEEEKRNFIEHEYETIMCYAAERNCPSVIRYLVQLGFDPDQLNILSEERPLHIAAQDNYVETAKALLESKVDVNTRSREGNTALHYAYINNHDEMVEFLLKRGADVNAKNQMGQIPEFATIDSV